MPTKNLHDKPFSESTVAKLEIFEDYAEAWIPTFVMRGDPVLNIYDFFAGTGYDKDGIAGSPIRILEKIEKYLDIIRQHSVKIVVILNEFEPDRVKQNKFGLLKDACEQFLRDNHGLSQFVDLRLYNEDAEVLFPKLLQEMKEHPSLVYLDQNGVKFLADKYLLEFEGMRQTDVLYFVSSSYFWRFGESEEFKAHLNIDMSRTKLERYEFVHRNVISQLRERLPGNTKLRLYPFSLKKGSNIYGIVFGATHPRAVDKFLGIVWKRNEINGEANFDIDNDASKAQGELFESPKLTKIEVFQNEVKNRILSGKIRNNFQLLEFAFEEGHLGSHASECLRLMKREGQVDFEGKSPLVTYDNVYKSNRKIEYIIRNDETKQN